MVDFLENFPGVDKNSLKRHWLANAISVRVSTEVIKILAAREDIIWIGENVPLQQTSYSVSESAAVLVPDGLEKGLVAINAPAMWALGYTGYGTKVFVADTGVDPTHPAISIQYHGNYFPKDQSWYPNPYEAAQNANGPFDCQNHGTHVTGTVLGLDRENNDTIGVAFNATWIGGAILCGIGTADNIGAFEWAVDPDGDDNTTDDMPDAINNSWYDSSLNGLDCYSIYVPILETTHEAKTKPTQHSVKELRSIGLQPDAIVLRSHTPLEKHVLEKTSLFCDVPLEGVINSYDVESVYDVPLLLEQEKLISVLEERLFGTTTEADLKKWKEMLSRQSERTLKVALVGKYVVLPDA